jgi:hypothetical protein
VILRICNHNRRLENRIRPARIGINPQEQRIGCEPAKIDDAVFDRLRRVRNLCIAFGGFIDKISQLWNLLRRSEDQIDRLVDVVFDWIERDDTGLPDLRSAASHPAKRSPT